MNNRRKGATVGIAYSLAVHVGVLTLAVALVRVRPVASPPLHLPGTAQGQRLMLTYSVGGPSAVRQSSPLHNVTARRSLPKPSSLAPPVPTGAPSVLLAERGGNATGDSALGDADIRVALPQVHPRPHPDLSTLPRGTAGDVIVDVVIDASGKVSQTTLIKGLGRTVDSTVMQALRDWTFAPATRNGQNIPSEQEILIHYERG